MPDDEVQQPMGAYFQTEPHFRVPAVTAPFQRPDQAKEAMRALREAGFEDVALERIERFPSDRGEMTDQPFPQSLTGQERIDRRFFSGVDEAISGTDTDELLGEAPYMVTVVLPEGDPGARDRALQILRRHGADVGLDAGLGRSDHGDPQDPDRS